jgi:hypothetical protein
MNRIVLLTEGMAATATSLTPEDQTALQNMQIDMQNDPRFEELNEQATKAQSDLMKRNPKAAAEFQKVTQEEGMKMAQAMMTALQKMMGQAMQDAGVDPNAATDAEEPEEWFAESPSPATRLKEATYVMMQELIDITDGVTSVEDIQEVRPEIAAVMKRLVDVIEGIVANSATLTAEELVELQSMQTDLQNDLHFKELNEQAAKAQAALVERNPEAGVELPKVMQEEGMVMAQAMMIAMQKLSDKAQHEAGINRDASE